MTGVVCERHPTETTAIRGNIRILRQLSPRDTRREPYLRLGRTRCLPPGSWNAAIRGAHKIPQLRCRSATPRVIKLTRCSMLFLLHFPPGWLESPPLI
jgi:hypothetical protein